MWSGSKTEDHPRISVSKLLTRPGESRGRGNPVPHCQTLPLKAPFVCPDYPRAHELGYLLTHSTSTCGSSLPWCPSPSSVLEAPGLSRIQASSPTDSHPHLSLLRLKSLSPTSYSSYIAVSNKRLRPWPPAVESHSPGKGANASSQPKIRCEGWKTAQSAKCFPHKHEDLSSVVHIHLGMHLYTHRPSSGPMVWESFLFGPIKQLIHQLWSCCSWSNLRQGRFSHQTQLRKDARIQMKA